MKNWLGVGDFGGMAILMVVFTEDYGFWSKFNEILVGVGEWDSKKLRFEWDFWLEPLK